MSSFDMVVASRRMLRSTPFHRVTKAPEALYYVALFATGGTYTGRPEVWRSWLQLGFALSTKDPPPDALEADLLEWTVTSKGARTAVHLSSARDDVLGTVMEVLRAVEGCRSGLAGQDNAAKAEAVLSDTVMSERIAKPAGRAFAAAGLRPDEAGAITGHVTRTLTALLDDDIASVTVAVVSASR